MPTIQTCGVYLLHALSLLLAISLHAKMTFANKKLDISYEILKAKNTLILVRMH